jgi:hypothetical protein
MCVELAQSVGRLQCPNVQPGSREPQGWARDYKISRATSQAACQTIRFATKEWKPTA